MDLLDVARNAARTYLRTRNIPGQYTDDVLSDACLGAAQAAANWDPAKGCSLTSHAHRRVNGAILDGVRDRSPVGRHQYRRGITLADLPAQRRTALSVDELAGLGWEPHAPGSMEDGMAAADFAGRMLATCTERERIVLIGSLVHGYPLADIGAVLGVSENGACQIRRRAISRLRAQFAASWLDAA